MGVTGLDIDNRASQEHRKSSEIILDLERLCQEQGFIYTFSFIAFTALWSTVDTMGEVDWTQRPNHQELSFLLGLMVKNQLSLALPESEKHFYDQNNRAHDLLEELQSAYSTAGLDKGLAMVEPIFYGGEGAVHFQFLEMAEERYENDREWIQNHVGTDLGSIIDFTKQLNQLSQDRLSSIDFFASHAGIAKQCFENFLFAPEDICSTSRQHTLSFLNAFCISPGDANTGLGSVGAYNELHSHPIILLANGKFFLPILPYLSRSIYESPFYWMIRDKNYEKIALRNRGDATERITHNLLAEVFNSDSLFRGVKIKQHGQDVTDIDVLAVLGNNAIIVQAKSKKLTIPARMGNPEGLISDFKKAVQSAYDQACLSRSALTGTGCELYDDQGILIVLTEAIENAYIICVTGDYYPAVAVQVYTYLNKQNSDPYPLAMSIFDLQIIAHYMRDPFDFVYYVRQRATLSDSFRAASEISLLGFHLESKMAPLKKETSFWVEEDFGQKIYADYTISRGHWPSADLSAGLSCTWKNTTFNRIVKDAVEMEPNNKIEVAFCLYDFAGTKNTENTDFFKLIESIQEMTLRDGLQGGRSISDPLTGSGISLICYPFPTNAQKRREFQEHFKLLSPAQKYRSFATQWVVLGLVAGSPRLIDMVWYAREPWQFNSRMEKLAQSLLKSGRVSRDAKGKTRTAPSRNDLCPCGSLLKFKKCHGRDMPR